jgi:16S rRNA (cytidine1402-2'-O)-methyltransferase
MPGTLYIVATPIGNLKDISHRALETLQIVDLIACEDTRHTAKLLNAYKISKKLVSYHEHNENVRSDELIERLNSGESIALVSDAGTPLINDPGITIVKRARDVGISIVPIPGPVAFVNAVVASGLPTVQIFFGGFLPSRKGERRKYLESVSSIPATLVFYESPHRLAKSLADCSEILGEREAAVVRELTKLHEEILTGRLNELAQRFAGNAAKGEIVLVIAEGSDKGPDPERSLTLRERVETLEAEGIDRRSALKTAAKECGISRSEAYRRLVEESK